MALVLLWLKSTACTQNVPVLVMSQDQVLLVETMLKR